MYNSIPVVSLYKDNCHAHNVTSSILINCGLGELVARTPAEYVKIVVDLVNDRERIDIYKKSVREKFMKLMEIEPFMNSYEKLLTDVYNEN
jgi:predicted O-linked N-acetylglucosamine transferase (SPINDLY family)